MNVIILSGPPRSGKDTAYLILNRLLNDVELIKFTTYVKNTTHKVYGLSVTTEHYEPTKDNPCTEFMGLTPRQAYIATSRTLKYVHGDDIVAKKTVEAIIESTAEYVVINDIDGDGEYKYLLEKCPNAEFTVIRLHREGCTFLNDCRSYVSDCLGTKTYDIHNTTLNEFETHLENIFTIQKTRINSI